MREVLTRDAVARRVVLARIAEELRSQYTLGCLPTNPNKDAEAPPN